MTDIVERLRDRVCAKRDEATDELIWVPDQDCHDAADEIERLRAALESMLNLIDPQWDLHSSEADEIYRAAKAALGKKT